MSRFDQLMEGEGYGRRPIKTLARDTAVDPSTAEIRVTFSKQMTDGNWSWSTASPDTNPQAIGTPRYLDDKRTCMLPVELEGGRTYAFWINSDKFKNFSGVRIRLYQSTGKKVGINNDFYQSLLLSELTWSGKHSSDTEGNGTYDAVDDPDSDGLTSGDEVALAARIRLTRTRMATVSLMAKTLIDYCTDLAIGFSISGSGVTASIVQRGIQFRRDLFQNNQSLFLPSLWHFTKY